jgi:predicted peptidase
VIRKLVFLFLVLLSSSVSKAQSLNLYLKKWLIEDHDTLPYRLLLPKDFNPSKAYPLILFLHGAGERGNDNEKQMIHGSGLFLKNDIRDQFPAIVVFPQCAENSYWSNVKFITNDSGKRKFEFQKEGELTKAMDLVQKLMKQLLQEYRIEKKQIYVGGLSMGGMGTFEIVRRNPKMFAAAFPICGGANPATAKKLKKTAWWVFHGAKDNVVPPEYSEQIVAALMKQKASVKFTLYPDANHNSWDVAFAEKDLIPWLFRHKK